MCCRKDGSLAGHTPLHPLVPLRQYNGVKNCEQHYWVLLNASCPAPAVEVGSGSSGGEPWTPAARLLVASFTHVLEPYFCGWPTNEASGRKGEGWSAYLHACTHCPAACTARLAASMQQHRTPHRHPLQMELELFSFNGSALGAPGCKDLPDPSVLPAEAASLGPWAPACAGTQPPAHDLLNATVDVARELLFAGGNITTPDCASVKLRGLKGVCAQVCSCCGWLHDI